MSRATAAGSCSIVVGIHVLWKSSNTIPRSVCFTAVFRF